MIPGELDGTVDEILLRMRKDLNNEMISTSKVSHHVPPVFFFFFF